MQSKKRGAAASSEPKARTFVRVWTDVFGKGLNAFDVTVYTAICSFASNETGQCYPSLATIAKRAGCSRSTVQKSVAALESRGLVRKLSAGETPESERRRSCLYTVSSGAETPVRASAAPPQYPDDEPF